MNDYYKNKVCLVTGASTGIGHEMARYLLEKGAIVYACNRNPERNEEMKQSLGKFAAEYGADCHYDIVNVKNEEEVKNWIEKAYAEQGRIDILVNNGGVGSDGKTPEIELYKWKAVLDTNLWGVIYGVHYVLPIMVKQGSGHIINVSSVAGIMPVPYQCVYVTSKYAVTGMSESLRYEMKPYGIDVSVICPTNVVSAVFSKGGLAVPKDAVPTDYAVAYYMDKIALGRTGIIPTAEKAEENYKAYRFDPEKGEEMMMEMSLRRKAGQFHA